LSVMELQFLGGHEFILHHFLNACHQPQHPFLSDLIPF
jgi:hypothetical protein